MGPSGTSPVRPLRRGDPGWLGRYQLIGRLGAGGMGVVFLARDPRNDLVAVKMVHRELALDEAFRRRFRSEVARVRQVPPFCTAEVLDADPDHDPPYLVVEFVDGPSLADDVEEYGPLSAPNVHSVAVGVASALTAIHGAGVVHRDLKPQNVLLARGSPKVIDFGLAKALETNTTSLTRPGQMVGTIDYMAPERLDGSDGGGSPAADIFAWGVVVAYAATGRAPFRGGNSQEVAVSILTAEPDLTGVPAELREPVQMALRKRPSDRPSARELLDCLVSDAPIRPVSKPRFRIGPRLLFGASLVATAMLILAFVVVRPAITRAPLVAAVQPTVAPAIAGTPILDVTDPVDDDNGPGTYQYPSAKDFRAGSFDLTRLRVIDSGKVVTFEVSLRDLSPTFGLALGAQLLDLFIRDPGAASFSTASPNLLRNFVITQDSAWSSRIEVQGYAAPVFVDARGRRLGTVDVVTDRQRRTIRIGVPKSSLGQPRRGWVFTVTLHGQDGFSPDQARAFARAAQDYQFGVCDLDAKAPICRADPTKVPKVMDVIPPDGVSQLTELDPTLGRVSLRGVTVR